MNSDSKSEGDDGVNSISVGPKVLPFSLHREDDFDSYVGIDLILKVNKNINSMDDEACDPSGLVLSGGVINRDNLLSGLNPIRKIDILPHDIFLLIKSQQALISGANHTATIATVCRQQTENRVVASPGGGPSGQDGLIEHYDFSQVLFGGNLPSKAPRQRSSRELIGDGVESRGRSRSRSQNSKKNLSASANLDDRSQERTSVDTNSGSSGQSNLRSRSMSGGPTRRVSSNSGAGVAQGSLRKLPSSSSMQSNGGGGNPSKPPLASSTSMGGGASSSSSAPSECLSARKGATEEEEEDATNLFSTLSSIPPEVRSYYSGKVGPIDGVWLNAHPLTLLPQSYYKTFSNIQAVAAKDLPPNKRNEWELDLLREYDDARMDKYEEYLVKCRKNPDKQINKFFVKQDVGANKKDSKDASKKKIDSKRDK